MPPRYAYWTILIDGKATAFRAREREELLPTFNQLARKNVDIAMRYFARGRLWDNPEQAQWASRNRPAAHPEPRDRDWRPGGQHKDPRARFQKSKPRDRDRNRRPFESKSNSSSPSTPQDRPRFRSKPPTTPEGRPLRSNDRREPRFEKPATKHPGGWRPPKRKPR